MLEPEVEPAPEPTAAVDDDRPSTRDWPGDDAGADEAPSDLYADPSTDLLWPPASLPSVEPIGPLEWPEPVEPARSATGEAPVWAAPATDEVSTASGEYDQAEMPTATEAPMAADDTADDTVPPAPVSDPAEPEPSAAPKGTGDDVLGDLEDWLNTLQDRSSQ